MWTHDICLFEKSIKSRWFSPGTPVSSHRECLQVWFQQCPVVSLYFHVSDCVRTVLPLRLNQTQQVFFSYILSSCSFTGSTRNEHTKTDRSIQSKHWRLVRSMTFFRKHFNHQGLTINCVTAWEQIRNVKFEWGMNENEIGMNEIDLWTITIALLERLALLFFSVVLHTTTKGNFMRLFMLLVALFCAWRTTRLKTFSIQFPLWKFD